MQWHDLPWGGEPGGVLELPERLTPTGLALELHVYARREGTLALWLLEDGRVVREIEAGKG